MFHFWLRLPTGWVWESGLGSLDFQVVFGHCENSISQKSWIEASSFICKFEDFVCPLRSSKRFIQTTGRFVNLCSLLIWLSLDMLFSCKDGIHRLILHHRGEVCVFTMQ